MYDVIRRKKKQQLHNRWT